MVCGLHHLDVMFHDHERIAEVTQTVKRVQEFCGIAFVKADGRFIKHVQDAFEAAADLASQTDALGFTARKRIARTVKANVT